MKRQIFIAMVAIATATTIAAFAEAKGGGGGHAGGHASGGFGGHRASRGGGLSLGVIGGAGFGGGYGGYGGCGDYGLGYLYDILREEVPHFAAFPPVYYSEPVPRTYGYSPFAYPPGVMTPEIACPAQPLTINNPYAPETKPVASPTDSNPDRSAETVPGVQPLVVMNPYVTQHSSVAQNEQ
jgi:hypothetical protein